MDPIHMDRSFHRLDVVSRPDVVSKKPTLAEWSSEERSRAKVQGDWRRVAHLAEWVTFLTALYLRPII